MNRCAYLWIKNGLVGLCLIAALTGCQNNTKHSFNTGNLTINWRYGADMPASNGGPMGAVINDEFFLAGGTNWEPGHKQWLSQVYRYAPKSNKWQQVSELPVPTAYSVSGTDNQAFYICGGSHASQGFRSCRKLIKTNSHLAWQNLPPLPQPRVYAGGGLINNTMYVLGGAIHPDDIHNVTNTLWALRTDKSDTNWRELAPLPGHQRCVMASTVCNDKLYVFGGCYRDDQQQVTNLPDAYEYSPKTNSWRRLGDLPHAMRGSCAVAYQNRYILILGGGTATTAETEKYGPEYGFQEKVIVYDIANDNYKFTTSMPIKIAVGQAFVIGDTVYYAGGEDKMRHRSKNLLIGTIEWR